MMRILKISYEFPPLGGGGSRVVIGLAGELVKQGHHVDLVTMGFKGLPRFEQVQGINVHRIPCIRLSESICRPPEMGTYLISALPTLNRLTTENQYDINHTHFIFPDALLSSYLKRKTGLPFIVTAHGSDVPSYNPNRFIGLHRIMKPVWSRVVNDADMVVSPSRSLSELIMLQEPNTPVRVIPNGIKIEEFDLSQRGKNRVLVVSRMFERKGVQYLLKALDGLSLPLQVDIVGEGPHLGELKKIASGLTTGAEIQFHGWVESSSQRFKEFFEKANIFVLPSESENFPIVLLEGMAASLAVITTRGTGCEEVVGDSGLLVDPFDWEAIQKALVRLYDDPELAAGLGAASRKRLVNNYGWRVVTDQYLQVYQEVIR